MKKEIILQEDDFNYLKDNSDSWINHLKQNTRLIKISAYLDGRYLKYYFPDFEVEIDKDIPEKLKHRLEDFKIDMESLIGSTKEKDKQISELNDKLNKIPNWIKAIFK